MGAHDGNTFQGLLDKFIEKYILCENCSLPELRMKVQKDTLNARCMECGWSGRLDCGHKIGAFICKNPPNESCLDIVGVDAGKGKKLTRGERQKQKEARKAAGGGSEEKCR